MIRTSFQAAVTRTVTRDSTPPDLALTITGMPGYTYLLAGAANLLCYGQITGSYTLTVTARDSGSGIAAIVLSDLTSARATFSSGGTFTHPYTFLPADTLSRTFGVTAQDRAGQVVTEPLTILDDALASTVSVTAPCASR